MSKLLMILLVAAGIYLFIRSYGKREDERHEEIAAEDMVRCAGCGVHFPRGEGIKSGSDFYCSVEHRDAAKK